MLSQQYKKHFLALIVLFVSISLAYINSLNGPWAMDDIVANKAVGIKALRDLVGVRKVAYVSFLINQKIAPFSTINFRLFNVLLHFFNAGLVYVLAQKTMLLADVSDKKKIFFASFFGSLIFALHPLNINAVAYIVQRMASLATLFVLLSLLCYIAAAQAERRLKAVVFYPASGFFLILGIFSKENAVMALPLIILYEYVFLKKFKLRSFIRKLLLIAVPGLISFGIAAYFLQFSYVLGNLLKVFGNFNQPIPDRGWTAVDVYWTPLQHILTGFRVVARYLFLIVVPLPQFFVFDWFGFPVSTGLLSPLTTLLSVIALLVLLVFSIWKLKRLPLLCFGILWYLIAISLESFLAVGSDLYFEHRNYLALTGLIIGLTGQSAVSLGSRINTRKVWVFAASLCLLLGALTVTRNFVWQDAVTLWTDTLKKNPSNLRAMMSLGNAYLDMAEMDKAEQYYKQIVSNRYRGTTSSYANGAAYNLGMMYLFKGDLPKAKILLEGFGGFNQTQYKILAGLYRATSGDIDGALKIYHEVLQESGEASGVLYTLIGDANREKGLWDVAIGYYEKTIALEPTFYAAYYGMGSSYLHKGNMALAKDYLNKTLTINSGNVLALSDLADIVLTNEQNPGLALKYAQEAVSGSPAVYQPYLAMGNTLVVLGREKEALTFYKKAAERNMPEYMIPFSMARAYYIKGDKERAIYYLSELKSYKGLPENIRRLFGKK